MAKYNPPFYRTNPQDVASWLTEIPGVHDVIPCSVTIRGVLYPAARYKRTFTTDASTPLYQRGEREHTQEFIYCVGLLPAVKRRRNVAFTLANEPNEWYVSFYWPDLVKGAQPTSASNEHHPFGPAFALCPWSVPDGSKIDAYERGPYLRVPVEVKEWSR